MLNEPSHMHGFEKEHALQLLFCNPAVRKHFTKWQDFMAVTRKINPELCERAFERKPCKRKLRYIGYDNFSEVTEAEKTEKEGLVYGNIYESVDFDGATYTIRETGTVIGMAYFEVVCDE
jgi:hypothetical protein